MTKRITRYSLEECGYFYNTDHRLLNAEDERNSDIALFGDVPWVDEDFWCKAEEVRVLEDRIVELENELKAKK